MTFDTVVAECPGVRALSKLPKKSVVLAGAEFGCFCT
jgi:hypothetical protein